MPEPGSECPDRRRERKPPTPASHDEVDDAERERHHGEDEREPGRPPARGAVGEEQAVGCPKRAADASIERAHERLRGTSELSEALAARGSRHRLRSGSVVMVSGGEAAREEAALLVEREWNRRGRRAAPQRTEAQATSPAPRRYRADAVRTRVRAGVTGSSPAIASRGRPATEVVDDDDGERVLRERRLVDEPRSAGASERAGIGRDESECVIRQRIRPDLLRGEPTGELDEHGGSGGVLAARLLRTGVVSVRNDDDGLLGATGDDADDVAELDLAEVCEVGGPDVLLGSQTERRDRLPVPDGRFRRTFGAGHSRRVFDASVSANVAAESASNSGSSGDRCNAPVVEIENRNARKAGTTTRKPTRTRRALRGRSTVP